MKYVFVQLDTFTSKARKIGLTHEDIRQIEIAISENAKASPVMTGTHGLRKIRFAPEMSGAGKSGGVRICYVVLDDVAYVYLITLFAKNDMENIDHGERNKVAALIDRLKAAHAGSPKLWPKK